MNITVCCCSLALLTLAGCSTSGPGTAPPTTNATIVPAPSATRGPSWPSLAAAIAAAGPTARASAAATGPTGKLTVIIHSAGNVHGVSSGETANVLSYSARTWRQVAVITVTPPDRLGPPPIRGAYRPPRTGNRWAATLTGATDFAVPTFVQVDAYTSAVLSDIGGHWHVVPFRSGNVTRLTIETDGQTNIDGAHGETFVTGTDNCIPDCARGTTIYQRWRYRPAQAEFTPTGKTFTVSSS